MKEFNKKIKEKIRREKKEKENNQDWGRTWDGPGFS